MSNAIIETLSEADDALENDEYEQFRELLPQIISAYDDAQPHERAFTERAKSITQDKVPNFADESIDSLDSVSRYLAESVRVDMNRSGALISIGAGLPNESAEADLQQTVSELKSSEESKEDARDAADPSVSKASVPALPRVYDVAVSEEPVIVDVEIGVIVTVGNAGDESIEDVEIGILWQRIAEGAVLAAGLSMAGSQFSLAIAIFSQTTITNPQGATVLGIPFVDLSEYFLQFAAPCLGAAIVAGIVGFVINHRQM